MYEKPGGSVLSSSVALTITNLMVGVRAGVEAGTSPRLAFVITLISWQKVSQFVLAQKRSPAGQ
jgi:hypothetical protein